MVNRITIGVIGIQGAVSEHITMMHQVLNETNTDGDVIKVKDLKQMDKINALIIPGGESSTISQILYKTGLYDAISKKINEERIPIMGTCAGCVILGKGIKNNEKDIKQLNAIDIEIKRNAFGRQRDSFEKSIDIKSFSEPYNAVFIRAPVIEKVMNNCEILAEFNKKIVMVKQNNMLAMSFHPELTDDLRIHKLFLEEIKRNKMLN